MSASTFYCFHVNTGLTRHFSEFNTRKFRAAEESLVILELGIHHRKGIGFLSIELLFMKPYPDSRSIYLDSPRKEIRPLLAALLAGEYLIQQIVRLSLELGAILNTI